MILIDSFADNISGESYCIVRNKGKNYSGRAKLHPEDDWSNFTGCRYAEMRAEIKALKAEYKEKKAACEECRKFVKAIQQCKLFDPTEVSAKMMFRQLNRKIREVNKLADMITEKEFALKVAIAQQDKFTSIKKGKKD